MQILKESRSSGPGGLRFCLGDRNRDVASALASAFADLDFVEVACGDLLDASPDCVVCPGNSFGDMGGGFDKAVDDLHGGRAQPAVVKAIAQQFMGELPVGVGLVVDVPDAKRARYLVMAPTMRVPGPAPAIGAYLATRGALVAISKFLAAARPAIRTVAIPGMCTGVGGMPFSESASQMRTAFASVVDGHWRQVAHPAMAPYALRGVGRLGGDAAGDAARRT
jgi:O-acetyl-ADP-ribose deacetylase (regulator of RNase III)